VILHIALRELRSLFLSPLAWTILAILQFILAWRFFVQLDFFFSIQPQLVVINNAPGVTDLVAAPLYEFAGILMLMIIPLMTMRLISEERRSGTLKLLLSSPVSMTEIVLGKYLAILLFLLVIILMISLMPLSLLSGTQLDLGKLLAGMLGLWLLVAAFAAAGLYLSSLTIYPTIAAVSTFGLLIMLIIIDAAAGTDQQASPLFQYLSIMRHNTSMLRGIVESRDVAYYLLFIFTFVLLTIRHLDAQRLQK
jgi:ABC-2 type transport system permease protein